MEELVRAKILAHEVAYVPPVGSSMHPGSFASKLTKYIEARPEHVFNIAEIHRDLCPDLPKRRLRSALHDLQKRKKIERPEKGLYRANRGATAPKEAPA
jgi:hypothetical protein